MKYSAHNCSIEAQIDMVKQILSSSQLVQEVLEIASDMGLENYYVGAGCITQTVWNFIFELPYDYGIKDIDIVYFDSENVDFETENGFIEKAKVLFKDIKFDIDIKNQARVHIWYEEKFGKEISAYSSLEEAINSWPTTATAIGVRKLADGDFEIYAPFGLNDLLGGIVRANKKQITEEIFDCKVKSWQKKWPNLSIIEWAKG